MLYIMFLYAVCASTFTLCKLALAAAHPFFYVGFRMTLAGVFLLGYLGLYSTIPRIPKKDYALFGRIILFHVFGAYMLDLWSLQHITSIESALLYNLSPFIAAIFSFIWFQEKLSWKKLLGLAIGFCSTLPLLLYNNVSWSGLPVFTMLGAVACGAYGWIVVQELVKHRAYSPMFVNGIGMLGGGLLAFLSSWLSEPWQPYPVADWHSLIIMTLAIIVVGNIIFYTLYGELLKTYSATLLSFAGFTCPLFVALYGVLFLQESITSSLIISVLCVIIGLALFYYEELKTIKA